MKINHCSKLSTAILESTALLTGSSSRLLLLPVTHLRLFLAGLLTGFWPSLLISNLSWHILLVANAIRDTLLNPSYIF